MGMGMGMDEEENEEIVRQFAERLEDMGDMREAFVAGWRAALTAAHAGNVMYIFPEQAYEEWKS